MEGGWRKEEGREEGGKNEEEGKKGGSTFKDREVERNEKGTCRLVHRAGPEVLTLTKKHCNVYTHDIISTLTILGLWNPTWPTSIPWVFFKLENAVYTIVTLFILQPAV